MDKLDAVNSPVPIRQTIASWRGSLASVSAAYAANATKSTSPIYILFSTPSD